MTTSTMTARQRQVYEFICEREDQCLPPSIRDICEHFRFSSPNAAFGFLFALRDKGLVAKSEKSKSRCWRTKRSTVERLAAIWKRCTRKEREAFLDGAKIT